MQILVKEAGLVCLAEQGGCLKKKLFMSPRRDQFDEGCRRTMAWVMSKASCKSRLLRLSAMAKGTGVRIPLASACCAICHSFRALEGTTRYFHLSVKSRIL